jgi:hypothetical protein
MDITLKLGLLPCVPCFAYYEPDVSGFTYWLAKNLGYPFRLASPVSWQHAWVDGDLSSPERIFGTQMAHRYSVHLVARETHQAGLADFGYRNVSAVGYPYLYMADLSVPKPTRLAKSLLVMPPHSLSDTSENWDEESCLHRIQGLKPYFETIVFCIHQQCIQKGYWLKTLDRFGFDYVIGSNANDANSLARMYQLFNMFEYVTTNNWGSHILYAAYSGAKVSAITPFFEKTAANYVKKPYINEQYRQANLQKLASFRYEVVRQQYPFFFCEPFEATTQIEWAQAQIGLQHKQSLKALAVLLNWTFRGQIQALPSLFRRNISYFLNQSAHTLVLKRCLQQYFKF